MTEEELMRLWGDGSKYGLSPNDEQFMNNAFREVAIRFAKRVASSAHASGFNEGYKMGSTGVFGEPLK
jgi:hypothetical protein